MSDLEDELEDSDCGDGDGQFEFFKDFTSSVSLARTEANLVDHLASFSQRQQQAFEQSTNSKRANLISERRNRKRKEMVSKLFDGNPFSINPPTAGMAPFGPSAPSAADSSGMTSLFGTWKPMQKP